MVAQRAILEGEPRAWWGRAKNGEQNGIEHVCFLGCCDASDVIDGCECIIGIMRGLGGNVNRLLPGVGFHVDGRKGRCGSLVAIELVIGREVCVCVSSPVSKGPPLPFWFSLSSRGLTGLFLA